MNNFTIALVLMGIVLGVQAAEHVEVATDTEPNNSIEIRHYRGSGANTKVYLETEIVKDIVVHFTAVKGRGFEGLRIGPGYYLNPDMEIGLGFGPSRYAGDNGDKRSHDTLSGFWYWKTSQVKAEIAVEHYRHDPAAWWYYAYAQTPIIGNLSAGVYGEKNVGWGPRVSWSLNKNSTLWATVPVMNRRDISAIMAIEVTF